MVYIREKACYTSLSFLSLCAPPLSWVTEPLQKWAGVKNTHIIAEECSVNWRKINTCPMPAVSLSLPCGSTEPSCLWDKPGPPRSAKQHLYRPFTNPLISVTFVWNEETTGSIQRGSLNKAVYIWHTVCDKYRMKANLNPWRRNRKISKMFVCRCGRILLLWQQTLHGQLCRWLSDRQKLAVVSMAM